MRFGLACQPEQDHGLGEFLTAAMDAQAEPGPAHQPSVFDGGEIARASEVAPQGHRGLAGGVGKPREASPTPRPPCPPTLPLAAPRVVHVQFDDQTQRTRGGIWWSRERVRRSAEGRAEYERTQREVAGRRRDVNDRKVSLATHAHSSFSSSSAAKAARMRARACSDRRSRHYARAKGQTTDHISGQADQESLRPPQGQSWSRRRWRRS